MYGRATCYTSDMNFLLFLAMLAGGIVAIIYSNQIVRIFGRMDWAERYIGVAGTYTAWKLIGLVMIIGSLYLMTHY